MPEAVIVSVARTPIGRAQKGSLKNERPDDLTAFIVDTALNKIPALDRNTVEDLILGCGQPAGEAGYNLARIVAIQAGMPTVPGVTVNRYCSSSLMSVRMAAQAIKAGEGDVFIAAGVETVSRFVYGFADSGPQNPKHAAAVARTGELSGGGQGAWTPFEGGLPDVYIAMGQTAENVATYKGVTRQEQDEFAALSQQRATASLESGFWENEITPVTTTDELIPSGETSSYRSNPLGLAEFTLSRRDPEYVGRAKAFAACTDGSQFKVMPAGQVLHAPHQAQCRRRNERVGHTGFCHQAQCCFGVETVKAVDHRHTH